MTASVTRAPGEDGILFTAGTQNSGLVFFVKDDRLWFDYNAFGDSTLVTSEVAIPADARQLTARFERSGQTGSLELRIDGDPCGRADIPWVMRMTSSIGARIGRGTHSPVSREFTGPFPFEGALHELVVEVDPSRSERERAEQAADRFDSEMSKQ
jgi:arylsulfatase